MKKLEQVARAVFTRWREDMLAMGDVEVPDNFESLSDRERAFALSAARVSIQAMRDPTEEMLGAGNGAREASMPVEANTFATWQAMIDEALK